MRHATIDDASAVAELMERCASADGQSPLSEFKALRVPVANSVRTLVATDPEGQIVALAVGAWHPRQPGEDGGYWAAEAAIDPAHRSVDAYRSVLESLGSDLGVMPSYWAFSADQMAAAETLGMREVRSLVEMARHLPAPAAGLPAGYSFRRFHVGGDERLWLALNQRVFADHPEAGSIDRADLALRMSQWWFDPDGLFILESEGEAVGYCWTKRHDDEVGEIYMIGLVPEYRGRGLARPLTGAGLDYLASTGAARAILYAEADNEAAVALYERMGFEVARRISLYAPGPT